MKLNRKNLLIAFTLYTLALIINVSCIDFTVIQPDEYHWVARAKKLYVMLGSDWSHATHHLGQPGITPTFIMAFGIYVIKHIFFYLGISLENFNYLQACRLSIAAFSALLIPLSFLGFQSFFSRNLALFISLFLMLDPRIIANSRMAHLDMAQGVLILLSFLLYYNGVEKARHTLKILAGIIWGLAFATKPTSLFLIFGFLFYRLCRFISVKKGNIHSGETSLISFSDFAAVFAGQLTFAAIYTRLWYHPSDYSRRLGIKSSLADWLYNTGMIFNNHLILSLFILIFLSVVYFFIVKKYFSTYRLSLNAYGSMLIVFLLIMILSPQVWENLTLFWTWTAGLSGEVHKTFGYVAEPPPWRYLELALSTFTDLTLLGLALSVILACINFKKIFSSVACNNLTLAAIPLIWILFLNTSDKQSWRYVIPCVPFIYFTVAAGIQALLARMKINKSTVFAVILIFVAALEVINWLPHLQLYYNRISGGIAGAYQRGQAFEFTGAGPIADYLEQNSNCSPKHICNITIFGDPRIFGSYLFRRYGPEAMRSYRFEYFRPAQADYVIFRDSDVGHKTGELWHETFQIDPAFRYNFKGVDLLKIIKIPANNFLKPIELKAGDFPYLTGQPVKSRFGLAMFVNSEKHQPGNVMFSAGYLATQANHYFKVNIWRKKSDNTLLVPAEEIVLKLKIDSCELPVKSAELSFEPKEFTVTCDNLLDNKIFPQIIWEGKDRLLINSFEIGKSRS